MYPVDRVFLFSVQKMIKIVHFYFFHNSKIVQIDAKYLKTPTALENVE